MSCTPLFRSLLLSAAVVLLPAGELHADACPSYTYCSRTPRYIIASSVVLGALAGAGAGFATGHTTCHADCDKKKHDHHKHKECNGNCFPTSEVLNTLELTPPSNNTIDGPLVRVTIYRPDQSVYATTSIGRNILPSINDLGGDGNPTQTGKWTASFFVTDPGTVASDFGGISIEGVVIKTLEVPLPRLNEEQQVVFTYPA